MFITTRINNNLNTDLRILTLKGTASQGGKEYAHFDYTFKNAFHVPSNTAPSAYSEMISPVYLTQGAAGSLMLALTSDQGLLIVSSKPLSLAG